MTMKGKVELTGASTLPKYSLAGGIIENVVSPLSSNMHMHMQDRGRLTVFDNLMNIAA